MAIITAVIVEGVTLLICGAILFAGGISGESSLGPPIGPIFVCGSVAAAAIFGFHFLH
jgi:hypothetical protein